MARGRRRGVRARRSTSRAGALRRRLCYIAPCWSRSSAGMGGGFLILLLPFRQEGCHGSMIDDEANEAKQAKRRTARGWPKRPDNPAHEGSWSFDESSKGYSPLAIATRPVRIRSINSFRNYLRHLH